MMQIYYIWPHSVRLPPIKRITQPYPINSWGQCTRNWTWARRKHYYNVFGYGGVISRRAHVPKALNGIDPNC